MPKILPDGTIVRTNIELKLPPKTDGRRRTSDWLAAFLEHTSELESPANYLRWAGLSTIAAVAQRKIYRDTQAYTIYPNMYVWLVGPPGTKKSTAIRSGRRLLTPAGTNLPGVYTTSDAPSIVGIMKDFADIPQKDHQSLNAFVYELSSLFENAPDAMTGFLTAIYDGDANYTKRTRIGGKEHIPFPWFNKIAGTTPRYLGDNLTKNAVEGGLVARTIFVYSEEQSFESPEPSISPESLRREATLTHDLTHILNLSGQFEWDGGKAEHKGPCKDGCGCGPAYQWYDNWYRNSDRMPRIPDNRTQGYFVRKPIHLLKVAMLLSLSKRDDKLFKVEDLMMALTLLDSIEKGMKKCFSAVGGNQYATDVERIEHQIKQAGGLSKAEIVAANYHNLDDLKMKMVLDQLESLGRVTKKLNLDTGRTMYYPVKEE